MNQPKTIFYRFKSEKRKYSFTFEEPDACISDIKRFIIKSRNLEKFPENFELIFIDEKTNYQIDDENTKIEPFSTLLIDRIPWYKLKNSKIKILKDIIIDESNRSNENKKEEILINNHFIRDTSYKSRDDPLEKIVNKINFDEIKRQFSCKLCGKLNGEPVLTLCCGETSCESCTKNNIKNNELYCPFKCEIKLKYIPNNREKGLREKLRTLLSDKIIKENNRLLKNSIINTNVSSLQIISQNRKLSNSFTLNNNLSTDVSPKSNYSNINLLNPKSQFSSNNYIIKSNIINQDHDGNRIISANYNSNPHLKIFEQSRFFIIKSSNHENIITSKLHNEWATTIMNQKKLNDAFFQKEVILIFSVNKSGYFQGYSLMTSFISDRVSNLWNNDYSVKLGGTFSIQWLVECEMSFNYVKNLNNPFNNNETVIKSRDTQEIPKEIGIQICQMCYEIQSNTNKIMSESEKLTNILQNNTQKRESIKNKIY